jgi:hypothetical protein
MVVLALGTEPSLSARNCAVDSSSTPPFITASITRQAFRTGNAGKQRRSARPSIYTGPHRGCRVRLRRSTLLRPQAPAPAQQRFRIDPDFGSVLARAQPSVTPSLDS